MVSTDGSAPTRSHSARPISRPVASPACSTRRTLCAASSPSASSSVGVAIEARAPVDQLADVARALLDEHADGGLVAQAVAGADRVGGVQLGAVVGADRRGDAALRVAGVALGRRRPSSESSTRPAGASAIAARRPGDAAADDEEVEVCVDVIANRRMLS